MIPKANVPDVRFLDLKNVVTKIDNNKKASDSKLYESTTENKNLLAIAQEYWNSLSGWRQRRERAYRYFEGNQWSEYMPDPNNPSRFITEEQYILSQGKIPFKQNIIAQIIRALMGQYLASPSQSTVVARARDAGIAADMMTNALQAALELNRHLRLDANNVKEFLCSGMAWQKIQYEYWFERNEPDLMLKNINPAYLFLNNDLSDPRLKDLRMIGELYDLSIDSLVALFGKTRQQEARIREIYASNGRADVVNILEEALNESKSENLSFDLPANPSMCRLIEIWQLKNRRVIWTYDPSNGSYGPSDFTKEEVEQLNQQRIEMGTQAGIPLEQIALIDYDEEIEQYWYVKYLSPFGECLYEGESPYWHQSHPYSGVIFPMVNGKSYGLVEELIDQQRYINRLIALLDFIMGASAKGVLMVHEDSIPKDMKIEDFADEWTKYNGVIKYKGKPGVPIPQQVAVKSTNIGATELLQMQLKFIMEISGANSAMQGHQPGSGTPASLYIQQIQQSSLNAKDMFDAFLEYKKDRDYKAMKVIKQFYKTGKYIGTSGKGYAPETGWWNKDIIKDIDFENVVAQSTDTPVYRSIMEEQLSKLLDSQLIDLRMFLENSSLPFADKLLRAIDQREQTAKEAQGQPGQPAQPDMQELQAMAQQGDPQARALIEKMMAA